MCEASASRLSVPTSPSATQKRVERRSLGRSLALPRTARHIVGRALDIRLESKLSDAMTTARFPARPAEIFNSRGYVLADLSGHHTPIEWARIAVAAYKSHGADRIVAEVNNGGEMVEATLRVVDDNVAYTAVHATRGKVVRAEPVAALYEQGRIRHMGAFTALEDQMCEFTPDLDRSKPKRDSTDPSSLGKGGRTSP